jgi:Family of unknown function (DUF6193)
MSEARDAESAWRWLLERKPGTRGAADEELMPFVKAAYAQPRLRCLYPFPTHGTLRFLRSAPPRPAMQADDLPFIVCDGPPYKVYADLYAVLIGEATTAEEAAWLVVAHLPEDLAADEAVACEGCLGFEYKEATHRARNEDNELMLCECCALAHDETDGWTVTSL